MSKGGSAEARIYAYVWFDIEDYVTVESDSLPLKAFAILERHGVPVTCKLVAEKARALAEHGRKDVIAAIAERDVGYHLDTHSRHPTVYEYLGDADILEGAEQFYSRERDGLAWVERAFSVEASCFGHPGPAWAPHVYPALRRMGIPVYLDETAILNLGGGPYWYCGVLNLNGANENFILFDYSFEDPGGLARLKDRFSEVHDRLERNGGAISILFHLHTAINTRFWDEVNFGGGNNRDKKDYVRPGAQPAEVTERAWRDFDEFMGHVASPGDVHFITARDAPALYRRDEVNVSRQQLADLLERVTPDLMHVTYGEEFLSPAEVFYLVTANLSTFAESGRLPELLRPAEPYGPLAELASTGSGTVRSSEILDRCREVFRQLNEKNTIPSSVRFLRGELSPCDFLLTASAVLKRVLTGGELPAEVGAVHGRLAETKYVDDEAFRKACQWKVLPEGFTAPKILQQIKLQTWTLRPAVPKHLAIAGQRVFS